MKNFGLKEESLRFKGSRRSYHHVGKNQVSRDWIDWAEGKGAGQEASRSVLHFIWGWVAVLSLCGAIYGLINTLYVQNTPATGVLDAGDATAPASPGKVSAHPDDKS